MDTNLPTLKYRTYTRRQNTEWITFIHGAGGSSTIWHKQIKFFKKDYNLLLIDSWPRYVKRAIDRVRF